jgi:DNA-binding HxlR family transcriptional regulator
VRAGGHALSLLSIPLNVHVLQALEEEPKSLTDLRRAVGSPPQTTMRGHLRTLTDLGVIERRRSGFPSSVDFRLGQSGEELLSVGKILQDWLAVSPDGPLGLGSIAAKSSIKALVEGWSSAIVRALAARPLSLTELNRLITGLSYPSLERRLGAMRLTGLIEARPGRSRSTPYAAGDWLRGAVAPIATASVWERRHLQAYTPFGRIDLESAFLLAVPPLPLPSELSGSCRLAAQLRSAGGGDALAGALVQVEEGGVSSCATRLEGVADAWVTGNSTAWLDALTKGESDALEVGGDGRLALGLLDALHGALFGAAQKA